ncbi:MAG: uroporphyrinogen-III synthase [Bacteroidota bacterium]
MASSINILSTVALDVPAGLEGVAVTVLPFIAVSPVVGATLQEEIARLQKDELTVAFTSANAVKAVIMQAAAATGWKIYCIGNATAQAVIAAFGTAAIAGTANDAGALAEVIIGNGVNNVVFFCGDKRMHTLPARLKEAGVAMKELVVYQTEETPHVVSGKYDAILFFSPSAVKSFFSVNAPLESTVLFAIGGTTAEAIRSKTRNKVVVCNTQSKDEVLAQAIAYFKKQAAAERLATI